MALSKEKRREIYGIKEPNEPSDIDVIARRPVHEALSKWELKWMNSIGFSCGVIALLTVLLPALFKPWKIIVDDFLLLSTIHRMFTTLNLGLFFIVAFGACLHLYSASKIDGKKYSHHGYPINLSGVRSSQQVIDMELYPRTKLEERVFWIDLIGGVWLATTWWFVIFGGFVMMLKLGGK